MTQVALGSDLNPIAFSELRAGRTILAQTCRSSTHSSYSHRHPAAALEGPGNGSSTPQGEKHAVMVIVKATSEARRACCRVRNCSPRWAFNEELVKAGVSWRARPRHLKGVRVRFGGGKGAVIVARSRRARSDRRLLAVAGEVDGRGHRVVTPLAVSQGQRTVEIRRVRGGGLRATSPGGAAQEERLRRRRQKLGAAPGVNLRTYI